MNFTRRL